ncbi:MAG: hypothetical protein GXY94_01885 [Bacteroidales bacterium]|nr:hypothetical protein [Bacteroidales bacterium]
MDKTADIYTPTYAISAAKMRKAMKLIALTLILLGLSGLVAAQSRALTKADDAFERFDYSLALKRYNKLDGKSESRYYVTKRIADCYRLLNMPVNALEWYEKAIEFHDVDAETYYHLGQTLRVLKRYEESDIYLNRFREITRTQAPQQGLSPGEFLMAVKSDSGRYEIIPRNVNSEYSEFGPAILDGNKLVFSSNRPGKSVIRQLDSRNNLPFFGLFVSELSDLSTATYPLPFLPKIKTELNDGPVSFTADGQMLYITRNTTATQEGLSELDIFSLNRRDGKWSSTLASLPLKIKGYSIAHPAVSPDNQRLYFSSDMPGGYGAKDLYYSELRGGFFSQPVNLGPDINTAGNDVFPFVDSAGRLFFASDGLPGLGGLDIFMTIPEGQNFSKPYNLGPGINTAYDDFSIVIKSDDSGGYFSSNRPGGAGSDDIYAFKTLKPLRFTHILGTIVNQLTGEPEEAVSISVIKQNGIVVANIESDEKGNYSLHLLSDEEYTIHFRKRMMQAVEKSLTPSEIKAFSTLNLNIKLVPR